MGSIIWPLGLIGDDSGWRRICELPDTDIVRIAEAMPNQLRTAAGTLDLGVSNGLPSYDCDRILELARGLDYDPGKCYRYVRDNIAYATYPGLLKGPERTLLDREGNELDQSFLLLALLRASDYANADIAYARVNIANGFLISGFGVPLRRLESASSYNAADWLGVDDSGSIGEVGARVLDIHTFAVPPSRCLIAYAGGVPYLVTDHFYVTLPTANGSMVMDPSVKPAHRIEPCDALADSGYSRSSLLAAAGGTLSGDYVQNLSKTGLAAYLDGLQTSLRNIWTNANSAASRFVGGSSVIAQSEDDANYSHGIIFGEQMSLLGQSDSVKNNYRARMALWIGMTNLADFYMDELGSRQLWLSFEEANEAYPRAVLHLDDDIIYTEAAGSDSKNLALMISTRYPLATTNTFTYTYPLSRNVTNAYAVAIGFGGDSPSGVRKLASQELAKIAASGSATSEDKLARSLAVAGQQWISQVAMCSRLRSRTCGYSIYDYYNIGIAGYDGSMFLDFKDRFGYYSNLTSDIEGDAFFSSALEHAVLDQFNGIDKPSVSTVKLIDAANAAGDRIYFATSNNCTSVAACLTGYSPSLVSNLQSSVAGGGSALLPQSGRIAVNGWTGYGYVMQDHANCLSHMKISGGRNGGFCTVTTIPAIRDYLQATTTVTTSPGTVNQSLSADPVVMPDGAYYDEVTDISLPGGIPLNWTRYYDSRQRYHAGDLGAGWHHGFEAAVVEVPDPDACFGSGQVEAVIPTAIANAVVNDMLIGDWEVCTAGEMARRWTLAAMVAQWWTERTTSSTVVVTLGARSLRFVRLAGGTFAPSPGVKAALERTIDGTYVLAERHGNTYQFNSEGRLATITDPSGNITTLTYDLGRLASVSNSFGAVLALTWANGRISRVDDTAGRFVTYAYDANGRMSVASDLRGKSTVYTYDPATSALATKTDPIGNILVQNTYNEFGQITNQVSDVGGVWKFGYCSSNEAWDESPGGGRRQQTFDCEGRVILDKARDGGWIRNTYDGYGHLVAMSNRFGRIETCDYGADELVLATRVNAENHETSFAYDAQLRVAEITNAVCEVTHFEYDGCGRIVEVAMPDGSVVSNAWTSSGLLATQTVFSAQGDAVRRMAFEYSGAGLPVVRTVWGAGLPSVGVSESYAYDLARRLVARTDANGHVTAFSYDNAGNVLSVTAPDGATTSFAYDDAGRLAASTDPLGRAMAYSWTPSGQLSSATGPDGNIITNVYDTADRLVSATDARGATIAFEYDNEGRLVMRTDAAGTASFAYNTAGLQCAATNAEGGVVFADYDFAYNPVVSSNANGRIRWTQCDGLDRVVATSNTIGKVRHFAYDPAGRRTSSIRPSGAQEAFGYDALGNCTAFTNAEGRVYQMAYDAFGRMTSATNALGECVFAATYDGVGNLCSKTDGEGNVTAFAYDAADRLVAKTSTDGVDVFLYDLAGNLIVASNLVAVETFAYDLCDRLTNAVTRIGTNAWEVAWLRDAGGFATNIVYAPGKRVVREYDATGRLVAVTDWLGNTWALAWNGLNQPTSVLAPDGTESLLAYDEYGQLASWSVDGIAGRTIECDVEGRRLRDTVTAGPVPTAVLKRNAQNTFDAADRLVSAFAAYGGSHNVVEETFQYNGNGAMTGATSDGEAVFGASYDAQGRLAAIGGDDAFDYDALGNRVRALGHIFVPDHSDPLKRPLVECDADGTPLRYYIWGPGRLLGVIGADGTLTIAHSDEQGSVIALTDTEGEVLYRASYSPHGEDWGAFGANPTPFAWLGGYGVMKVETASPVPSAFGQLYLTRHRVYSPVLRRFLSADPLGLDGGLNLYAYANGNPLAYIDPLGLCALTRIGGMIQMIGGSIEAAVGLGGALASSASGVGIVAGLGVALHGLDSAIAGYNTMVSGVSQDTLTSQGLQAAGLSPDTAAGIDAGISIVGMMGAGAAARGSIASTDSALHLSQHISERSGAITIQFGGNENQIYHTFRHIDKMGLDRGLVQKAIADDINATSRQLAPNTPFIRNIIINGNKLQYNAYLLSNGVINIGRINGVP